MFNRRNIVFLLCGIVGCFAGCKEPAEIVQYRVPKDQTGLEGYRSLPSPPKGWKRAVSDPRFLSYKFSTVVDGSEIVLSLTPLPVSSWNDNVARWAGQVGIELSAEQVGQMTVDMTIDELPSKKITLASEDPEANSIVGTMTIKGNQAWFIKLTGKRSAVESVDQEFNSWVESLTLP